MKNSSIQYKFIINNTKNQNPFQNLKKVWLFVYFLIQYNDLNTAHRKNKPVVRKKKDFCMLWFVYTFVYKKDFTLMNSNTEHIYCYAQKYCHFLAKFHYHKDLLKARTIHIVFWLEEVVRSTEKAEKFFCNFSSQLIVEDEMCRSYHGLLNSRPYMSHFEGQN